jgi:hypothetical protein
MRARTPGEHVALFTASPLDVPGDWQVDRSRWIEQMVQPVKCGRDQGSRPPWASSTKYDFGNRSYDESTRRLCGSRVPQFPAATTMRGIGHGPFEDSSVRI